MGILQCNKRAIYRICGKHRGLLFFFCLHQPGMRRLLYHTLYQFANHTPQASLCNRCTKRRNTRKKVFPTSHQGERTLFVLEWIHRKPRNSIQRRMDCMPFHPHRYQLCKCVGTGQHPKIIHTMRNMEPHFLTQHEGAQLNLDYAFQLKVSAGRVTKCDGIT